MSIRLLGDAVLRRRAWEIADRLGWASTYNAEYIALTQLQADAFITLDEELARSVQGIVATASIDALLGGPIGLLDFADGLGQSFRCFFVAFVDQSLQLLEVAALRCQLS